MRLHGGVPLKLTYFSTLVGLSFSLAACSPTILIGVSNTTLIGVSDTTTPTPTPSSTPTVLYDQWTHVEHSVSRGGSSFIVRDPHFSRHFSTARQGFSMSTDGGATWTLPSSAGNLGRYLLSNDIISVASNQNLLFANTDRGLAKSTDAGVTWSFAANAGAPFDRNSGRILVNPSDTNVLYAIRTKQLYKTTDGGATWTQISPAAYATQFQNLVSIAMLPSDPLVIYAAAYSATSSITGVFKTTDGGSNWTDVSGNITTTAKISGMDFDPVAFGNPVPAPGYRLYVTGYKLPTGTAGLTYVCYHDTPGTGNWTCPAMPWGNSAVAHLYVGRVGDFSPANDHSFVLVGTDNTYYKVLTVAGTTATISGTQGATVDRSANYGVSYGAVATDIMVPSSNRNQRSTDGGSTFSNFYMRGFGTGYGFTINPNNNQLQSLKGYSTDGGETWTLYGGVFDISTEDAGGLGTPHGTYGAGGGRLAYTDQWVFPQGESTVCLSAVRNDVALNVGVLISTDGCKNFSSIVTVASHTITPTPGPMVGDPTDGDIVYLSFNSTAGTARSVFKSTDMGATWTQATTGLPSATAAVYGMAHHPTVAGKLYLTINSGGGFYVTTDGAANWAASNTGIAVSDRTQPGRSIAISPVEPDNICFFTGSSFATPTLYCSTDGAANWASVAHNLPSTPLAYYSNLQFDPVSETRLWTSSTHQGVFYSDDMGVTWTALASQSGLLFGGVVPDLFGIKLMFDPSNSKKMYLGHSTFGVFEMLRSWQ